MERRDETRRLLKVFGVAVTDFEEESETLLSRLASTVGRPATEAVPAVRDALELLLEVNQKWLATTHHLFETQRRFLEQAIAALPEEGGSR
jgi:hypothetical protein